MINFKKVTNFCHSCVSPWLSVGIMKPLFRKVYTRWKKPCSHFCLLVGPSPGFPGLELRQMQRTGETSKNGSLKEKRAVLGGSKVVSTHLWNTPLSLYGVLLGCVVSFLEWWFQIVNLQHQYVGDEILHSWMQSYNKLWFLGIIFIKRPPLKHHISPPSTKRETDNISGGKTVPFDGCNI